MRDQSDKSFDQIADDEEDFEFGSRERFKNFDYLAIDWWSIALAVALYLAGAYISYAISLLLFGNEYEARGLCFTACAFVSSVPGALLLKARVKTRRLAHAIYYSIAPMAVLIAQPQVMALGPAVAIMLILGTVSLTTALVTMNVFQLFMLIPTPEPARPADPESNLYEGLQMPGDKSFAAYITARNTGTPLDVNNPYLESAVSGDSVATHRGLHIAWISILIAAGIYFSISFALLYALASSYDVLFEITHHNYVLIYPIFYGVRLLPGIAAATLLGITVRQNWLWNAVVFVLLLSLIHMGLSLWNNSFSLDWYLNWILEDAIAVVMTCAVIRFIARVIKSLRKRFSSKRCRVQQSST